MNPSLFGSRERTLFGIYASAGRRARRGVVLCPSIGQEYLRSHRSLRVLSQLIRRAGNETLRFDYFGTGDSAGEASELSIAGSVEDVHAAIDEIRDLSGVRKVTLVGLRVGAFIAARAAGEAGRTVDEVVLWDPILDGSAFVRDLRSVGQPFQTDPGGFEAYGFPFLDPLLEELEEIGPEAYEEISAAVLLAVSEALPKHTAVVSAREAAGRDTTYAHLPNESCWSEQGDLGVGAIPADLLNAIAEWNHANP